MRKQFLFPVLYNGDKPGKTVHVGRPLPVSFDQGDRHLKPYAMLTEDEARQLIRKSNGMFSFPEDLEQMIDDLYLVNKDDIPDCVDLTEEPETISKRKSKKAK